MHSGYPCHRRRAARGVPGPGQDNYQPRCHFRRGRHLYAYISLPRHGCRGTGIILGKSIFEGFALGEKRKEVRNLRYPARN